jgi:diacylglycerol O-acyltransferase / wax synthase
MRLTEADASFIYMESASGPMHISSVYVLDGVVPFDTIFRRFEKRIHLIPAYRRKLVQIPFSLSHPVWVDDTEFDLSRHVFHHVLPGNPSLEEGVDAAVDLNEPLMDRSKPLWEFIIIEGVPDKTLLLQRAHHAMIDGASGIELTTVLYDLDKDAGEPVPPNEPWEPQPTPGPAALISAAVEENMKNIGDFNPLKIMGDMETNRDRLTKASEVMSKFSTQPAITAPFNAGIVGPKRKVRWIKKPFGEIRDIRRQLGGTINDIVLAVVTEAVARYLQNHDEPIKGQKLRIMCPVNVRTENQQGALGNQVSAIFPMFPAEPMSCTDRLKFVIDETTRIKEDEEAQAFTVMQETTPSMPPLAMAASQLVGTPFDPTAFAARIEWPIMPNTGFRPPNPGYNFTCTNVPGIQVPQYMCGHEVTDTIGFLVLSGNVGFSVTILSYNKQLFFNFICEPRLMPDLEVMIGHAEDVYQELIDVAGSQVQSTEK